MSSTVILSLPYRYRLLINMVEILMWFFNRDERMVTLIMVTAREVNDLTEDENQYDAFVDALADGIKLERRLRRYP
jgi:hypothetical protein